MTPAPGRGIQAPVVPSRYLGDRARAAFGDRVDRLEPYLMRADPLADAVARAMKERPTGEVFAQVERALAGGIGAVSHPHPSVVALFAEVDRVPPWVDWPRLDRGGEVLLRSGYFGGLVLGVLALPHGYASPGGNKPLAFSGRLMSQAPRRLSETARFVLAVASPGGLSRHADGFAIAIKVRIMHAQVRRLLAESGRWQSAAWGAPINQHDMVATTMLFSITLVDGLRKLGFSITAAEADDYVHLWKYAGWLMGVDLELLPSGEVEALGLSALILATQGPPDEDSRALTAALLAAGTTGARSDDERKMAQRIAPISRTIARYLMGAELADGLGVPRQTLPLVIPLLRGVVGAIEAVRTRSGAIDAYAVVRGAGYWREVIRRGLGESPAAFGPPETLANSRPEPPIAGVASNPK